MLANIGNLALRGQVFFCIFIKKLPEKCTALRDEKLVRLKYSPLLDLYQFMQVIISYRRDWGRYSILRPQGEPTRGQINTD